MKFGLHAQDELDWNALDWRLEKDEVPLLCTTAGVFRGTTLVLTTKQLIAFKKNLMPNYMPFAEFAFELSGKHRDRVIASNAGVRWEYGQVDLAEDIAVLSGFLPTSDPFQLLQQLNRPKGIQVAGSSEFYKGMSGHLDREVAQHAELAERKVDSRYADVWIDLWAPDGESYVAPIARALKSAGYSSDIYEEVDVEAGDIVHSSLQWHVTDGQVVHAGEPIASLGRDLILAPASGTLETLSLYWQDDDDEEDLGHDKEQAIFPSREALDFTTWAADPVVARILVDHSLPAVTDRIPEEPGPMRIRNPRDAEEAAAQWMRYWGWADAQTTPPGADEGKDVDSREVVAQVKAHANPIGRPDVQNLYGVAQAESKTPLFFSLSDYTNQAREWADRVGIALFLFDLEGRPEPANVAAQILVHKATH